MHIGIFGLGIIGLRCADQHESRGRHVQRWTRSQGKHPQQFPTLELAVMNVDAACLYLKDREAIRQIAPHLVPHLQGRYLLNHATIDLPTTMWLAEFCHDHGVRFVDAPFTGSKNAASQGKLLYYLAGNQEDCQTAATIIEPTSCGSIQMGAMGNATVMKLATNHIAACQIQAIAEAQALCLGHGITAENFAQVVLSHGTKSALVEAKLPCMLAADYETHFSLDNMRKDSLYAAELGEVMQLDLPALCCLSARLQELCNAGHAEKDYTALGAPYQTD
jgi:3-hydroxyisobutyrate dehydrogenase/glyoxylate/succinic semialdehyde reductase